MRKKESFVWITFQYRALHRYINAATDPKLSSVSFLANQHRHLFKFRVAIEVFHNDRDIEFLMFQDWCMNLYSQKTLELDFQSCEMMSDALADKITKEYPGRDLIIEVSEDGENGSSIRYEADK